MKGPRKVVDGWQLVAATDCNQDVMVLIYYVKMWMTGDSCQSWAGPILAGGDFSVIEDYFLWRN